jgi:tellurite resistance protein TerC
LVFLWLFQHFKVPETQQNRILTLGIGGAIVLRLFMIMAGSALLERFDILFIPFGLLLCFAGWQMFRQQEKSSSETKLLRITHYLPIHPEPRFDCFWLQQPNGLRLTTLTVVIILVEAVDVLFAIDSIPAIFSITQDTYIVFTSNILAILGLRSVYHILSKWISKLRYLMPGLGLALMGLGLKMLFLRHIEIPAWILLGFISSIVLFSTLKSLYSR